MNTANTNQLTSTWYVELNGERRGPINEAEVGQLLTKRFLHRDSLCWQQGFTEWKALHATKLATLLGDEPPPLSGKAVPNGLVWTLAFAPIIGVFLSGLVFGITANPLQRAHAEATGSYSDQYWWITIVLNVLLSVLDERKLKKAGYNTKAMGSAWLVPVYLYKRATTLKHNLAYFFLWIASFFASLFL